MLMGAGFEMAMLALEAGTFFDGVGIVGLPFFLCHWLGRTLTKANGN